MMYVLLRSPSRVRSFTMALPIHDHEDYDEAPMPQPRGSELWDTVSQWMEALGTGATKEKLSKLDQNPEYKSWLDHQLLMGERASWSTREKDSKHVGTIMDLPSSLGREVGYRAVSHAGLLQKMRDLCIAQEWREWDEARLCCIEAAWFCLLFLCSSLLFVIVCCCVLLFAIVC